MFVDLFFFFKQKTAYEMRISDWSSDVCSSDLEQVTLDAIVAAFGVDRGDRHRGFVVRHQNALPAAVRSARILGPAVDAAPRPEINRHIVGRRAGAAAGFGPDRAGGLAPGGREGRGGRRRLRGVGGGGGMGGG